MLINKETVNQEGITQFYIFVSRELILFYIIDELTVINKLRLKFSMIHKKIEINQNIIHYMEKFTP